MFELRDGRECLWQWDIDVQVIVSDPTITEVHFCNKTDECSLVVEVHEEDGLRLANVPNILLQSDWSIRAYAYCVDHTIVEEVFKVHRRTKPADYVYTETEIATWDSLEARMTVVENTVTKEGIAKAVDDYLTENPIEAGATEAEKAQINANTNAINELKNADYLTKSEVEGMGYITTIPSEYITEKELSTKGFLTQVPSEYITETELVAKDYATEGYVATAVSDKITMNDLTTATANFVTEAEVIALIEEHGGTGALPSSEEAEF